MALLLSVVFAVSYTQAPLYSSNQQTYFLHGLARGGFGLLSHDWMANTVDPFPLFSLLVELTYSHLPTFVFYLYYAVILGIFIVSVMGIVSKVFGTDSSREEYLTQYTVITGLFSACFALASWGLLGINLSEMFQMGIARQYILGSVFQPSAFGVFLIVSIYAFLCDRPFLAVFLLSIAGFHDSPAD
jgi:hypothetical protein